MKVLRQVTLQPVAYLTPAEREAGKEIRHPYGANKPKTRGDCVDGHRPCPWVSCKHNLYLEVNDVSGAVKLNFPHLEPHEMGESCALDVADQDGATLEQVAQALNLTRERVRQIEFNTLYNINARPSLRRKIG